MGSRFGIVPQCAMGRGRGWGGGVGAGEMGEEPSLQTISCRTGGGWRQGLLGTWTLGWKGHGYDRTVGYGDCLEPGSSDGEGLHQLIIRELAAGFVENQGRWTESA